TMTAEVARDILNVEVKGIVMTEKTKYEVSSLRKGGERQDDALTDQRAREAGLRLELAQVEAAKGKAEMAKGGQHEAVLKAKVEEHRKAKAELEQIRVKEEAAKRRAEKERNRRNRPLSSGTTLDAIAGST
ncbi:hypothetical protein FOL47_002373, partial [Perkinsus chesapeaki]